MIAGIRLTGPLTGLLIIVLTVVAAAAPLSPPAAMLVVAAGLFLILKVFTFASQVRPRKSWSYLPLWCVATPTLNASDFFASPQPRPEMRWTSDFLQPLLFALAGLTTIVFVVPSLKDRAAYLSGYVAIAALLAVAHFGLLHLVVSLWKLVGLNLKPLMNAPWRALTVAEFWGQRWNTAFRDLVHRHIFLPTLRRHGQLSAMLCVFIASGLIHEIAISVPARAGYGGPTLYFLIQAAAMFVERKAPESRTAPGRIARRIVTWIALLLPVPLLFHEPFRDRVIAPLLLR